jgi:hypothetical protein
LSSSGQNVVDNVLSSQTGVPTSLEGVAGTSSGTLIDNHDVTHEVLSKQQLKAKRSDNCKLPWLNSEKLNIVKLQWTTCEVEEPVSASESVYIEGETPVTHVFVYSIHTLPYILAMINNCAEQMFIDTGSSLNLCAYGSYPDEHVQPVSGVELTSASGHVINLEGRITLKVLLGTVEVPVDFVLIKGLEMKLLLGNSLFRTYDFKMNYKDKICEFFYNGKSSGPIPLLLLESPAYSNPVINS